MLTRPLTLAMAQARLGQEYFRLWQHFQLRLLGLQTEPVAAPDSGDKRFRNELWQNVPYFDFLKQFYLITSRHIYDQLTSVEGMDERDRVKVDFFTRQFLAAMSPSNFAATNPEVWDQAIKTGGRSLFEGWNNFLRDYDWKTGLLRMKQADVKAFQMGKNIAASAGKVVYQTDLMQLLQFEPTTETVLKRPLLIVPPWINKYYILDLKPTNSFIKWACDQGHTVFVISWVNPDARLAGKGFDSYLSEGTLAAVDAVERQTGERNINAIGYCIGGTLLATTLGYMAGVGDKRIAGATFFTTMTDFANPGELGIFIDEQSVSALECKMSQRGFLEGYEMASAFSMMRSQDVVWPIYINRYLLGKQPPEFDVLYWNSDSTRMPAPMHGFYLRNMYLNNLLREKGGIKILGVPIDLSKVTVPSCFVSTVDDHIAPWKSTYAGARLFGGPVRFILGGSGHVAGIINPPSANKYGFWVNDSLPASADEWFGQAVKHPGSWWPEWHRWAAALDGIRVPSRDPKNGPLPVLENAPGSYCTLRLDAEQ
ncbi:MAG TPA: class I poly(R)-hydroxyalkanoic acid synthase [Candidatus Obscuribacterales bacterium]